MTTTDTPVPDTSIAPQAQATAPWTAELAPDLKSFVEAKGFKTPADLARAHADVESTIGADRIALPKDGAWDAAARAKLGIPEAPDKYTLRRPELPAGVPYDEALEKAALPVAHKLGLTPHQLQGLVDFVTKHRLGEAVTAAQSMQLAMADTERELRAEFGKGYDSQVTLAARAARRFGGDELIAALNETGFGNNPYLVRAFAKIGAMFAEDRLHGGTGDARFTTTRDDAMREIARIQGEASANPKHAYWHRDHPEHALILKRLEDLHAVAHAPEPEPDRARGTVIRS